MEWPLSRACPWSEPSGALCPRIPHASCFPHRLLSSHQHTKALSNGMGVGAGRMALGASSRAPLDVIFTGLAGPEGANGLIQRLSPALPPPHCSVCSTWDASVRLPGALCKVPMGTLTGAASGFMTRFLAKSHQGKLLLPVSDRHGRGNDLHPALGWLSWAGTSGWCLRARGGSARPDPVLTCTPVSTLP